MTMPKKKVKPASALPGTPLRNPKHEKFAQLTTLGGMSAMDAYRSLQPASLSPKTKIPYLSNLADVKARRRELFLTLVYPEGEQVRKASELKDAKKPVVHEGQITAWVPDNQTQVEMLKMSYKIAGVTDEELQVNSPHQVNTNLFLTMDTNKINLLADRLEALNRELGTETKSTPSLDSTE